MHARSTISSIVLALAAGACGGESGPAGGGLATVEITPGDAELFTAAPGNTITLSVVGKDEDGQVLGGGDVSYTSSAPAVATVSGDGIVTAVAAGAAQIDVALTIGGTTVTSATQVTVEAALAEATVTAPALAYTPAVVDIAAGGTVTWTMAAVQHDVDFTTAGAPADVPVIQDASASRTFANSGAFPYRCTLHAGMTGQVRVH